MRRRPIAVSTLAPSLTGPDLPPRPHRIRQLLQHLDRGVPIDTRVCDAHTPLQPRGTLGRDFLVAFVEVRLDHDADDGFLAFAELVADGLGDDGLVFVVFLGVAWRWRRRSVC